MSAIAERTCQIPAEVLGPIGGGGPAAHEKEEEGVVEQGVGAVGAEDDSETRNMKQEERQTRLSKETEGPVSFDRKVWLGIILTELSHRASARAVPVTRGLTVVGCNNIVHAL